MTPSQPTEHSAQDYCNLGNTLRNQGRIDEAIAAYRKAAELRPDSAPIHNNLGLLLRIARQFDDAIISFQHAVQLRPDMAEIHSNMGVAFKDNGQLEPAIACFRQAIALKPDYAEAHGNLGNALKENRQLDQAVAAHVRAIELQPDRVESHANLALTCLLKGDFQQGWREHEWRWKVKAKVAPPNFSQPQWFGEPLHDKTILIHAEQGFGDVLQFARYIPLVAQRGGKIIFQSPPELLRLMQNLAGVWKLLTPGEPLPDFDFHCALLSLPLAFDTRLESIPSQTPYLAAPNRLIKEWQERLAPTTKRRVGLVWAGNPSHTNDHNRSMSLTQLAPLSTLQNTDFYSLQKGPAVDQAITPPAGMTLIDLTADLGDFADTAALIANLDLVISVDTSVAHLAGAMAKPVWVMLSYAPEWRWMLDRPDSPWYPTMKLFRQSQPNDWPSVVNPIAMELGKIS